MATQPGVMHGFRIWAGLCAICTIGPVSLAQVSGAEQAKTLDVLLLKPGVLASVGVSPQETSAILTRLAGAETEVADLLSAVDEVGTSQGELAQYMASADFGALQGNEQREAIATLDSSVQQAQGHLDSATQAIRAVMFVDWTTQELEVLDATVACAQAGLPVWYGPAQLDARGRTALRRALRTEALSQDYDRPLQQETEQFLYDLRHNYLVVNARTNADTNTVLIEQLWPSEEAE